MMIIPKEESKGVYQVVRYIHSPALFVQRDDSDTEAKKTMSTSLNCLGRIENLFCRSGRNVCPYIETIGKKIAQSLIFSCTFIQLLALKIFRRLAGQNSEFVDFFYKNSTFQKTQISYVFEKSYYLSRILGQIWHNLGRKNFQI